MKLSLAALVIAFIVNIVAWLITRRERRGLERVLNEARKYDSALTALKIPHPIVGEPKQFLDEVGGRRLRIAERIVRYSRYGLAIALIFVCLLAMLEAPAFEPYYVAASLLRWAPIAVPLALALTLADVLYRALTLARIRCGLSQASWFSKHLKQMILEGTKPESFARRVLGYEPRAYAFIGGSITKMAFKEGSKSRQILALYMPREHRDVLPEFVRRVVDRVATPVIEGIYVDLATGSLVREIQEEVFYTVIRDRAGEVKLHGFLRLSPYAGRNFLIASEYIKRDAASFDSVMRAALPSLDRRITVVSVEGTTGFVAGLSTVGEAIDLVTLWTRGDLDSAVTLEIARGGAEKREMLVEFLADAMVKGRVVLLVHNEPDEDPRQVQLLDILLSCASSSAVRELPRVASERLALRLIEEGASPLVFVTKPLGGELPVEAERGSEEVPDWLAEAYEKPMLLAVRGPMARRLHAEPVMAVVSGERDEVVFGFPLNWGKLQERSELIRDVSRKIEEKIEHVERAVVAELAAEISRREEVEKLKDVLARISEEELSRRLGPVVEELLSDKELKDRARRLAATKQMIGMEVRPEDELEALVTMTMREALKRPAAVAPAPDRIKELTRRIVRTLYRELNKES